LDLDVGNLSVFAAQGLKFRRRILLFLHLS
jgi:hypothetical protein